VGAECREIQGRSDLFDPPIVERAVQMASNDSRY
jgi:hypothetical protein